MKEVWSSILEVSRERIKNPFIGSFAFSWVVFNWKPLMYMLFSSDTMENKITYVQNTYENIWNGLLYPLIFALIYIVVLPYIMWVLERLFFKAKSGRKSNKLKEDLETLKYKQVTTRESLKLENIKADYKETAELNEKIEKLNLLLEGHKMSLKDRDEKIIEYKNEIDILQKEKSNNIELNHLENSEFLKDNILVQYFGFKETDIFSYFGAIGFQIFEAHKMENPPTLPLDIILEFERKKIIKDITSNGSFKFTTKGKNFWDIYQTEENKRMELTNYNFPPSN